MKSLNFATVSETRRDEQDLARMNDEGCPNDLVLNVPQMPGIEGTCDTLGQILDRPESLGLGASVSTASAGSYRRRTQSPEHRNREKVGIGE
jgi:hypothetical protein